MKEKRIVESELPQWYYDLADRGKARGVLAAAQPKPVAQMSLIKKASGKDKDNGSNALTKDSKKRKQHEDYIKVKRAWEVALAPVKALPMNLIMSYFSGNGLQMVTITMTLYMYFMSPLQQIAGLQSTFAPFEGGKSIRSDIRVTKLVYILCSLLTLAAGVWKVGQMGLLPNHRSDWLAFEEPTVYTERALLL